MKVILVQLQMLVLRPGQERQSGAPLCSSLLLQVGSASPLRPLQVRREGGREGRGGGSHLQISLRLCFSFLLVEDDEDAVSLQT